MNRILSISAAVCALAMGGAVAAQTSAQPAAKSADASKAAPAKKPVSQSRKEIKSEAKGMALATEVTENISAGQLEVANRVLTGKAECEFNQHVSVEPIKGKPGAFNVSFKNVNYVMIPEETTTGAVRLENKKQGIVWLQIPSKSMMMNSKVGQRMVDGCMHAEQRAAVNAVNSAKQ
jgi:hypothetical protein